MGKEVKIGLAVIGVLLCVFGGVLAMRLKREQPANAVETVAAAEKAGKLGGKKKPPKAGKIGEAGNSGQNASTTESSLDQPFSSRAHRGNRPGDDAKTDRYGRPMANDWALSAEEGNMQADVADNQAPALDLHNADVMSGQDDDRYGRYSQRDRLQEPPADGGELALEEPAQDEPAMPVDRFASAPGGLSFTDDEAADNTAEASAPGGLSFSGDEPAAEMADANDPADPADQADDLTLDDAPASALRLTAVPRSNGSDPDHPSAEPREEETEDQPGLTQNDSELNLAPLAADESNAREPATTDRIGDRFGDRRGESNMLAHEEPLDESPSSLPAARPKLSSRLTHEEPVDEAPLSDEPVAADSRERWQEPASDSYTVAANDNFWRISQKVYGTGAYFKALEEHNRRQLANRRLLNVGDVVSTPTIEQLQRDYPSLSPKPRGLSSGDRGMAQAGSLTRGGNTYTVLEGDTLFDIARQELGKASRWAEIYELNRDQLGEDFNYLAPGMRLALPSGGDNPIATRPARAEYRR